MSTTDSEWSNDTTRHCVFNRHRPSSTLLPGIFHHANSTLSKFVDARCFGMNTITLCFSIFVPNMRRIFQVHWCTQCAVLLFLLQLLWELHELSSVFCSNDAKIFNEHVALVRLTPAWNSRRTILQSSGAQMSSSQLTGLIKISSAVSHKYEQPRCAQKSSATLSYQCHMDLKIHWSTLTARNSSHWRMSWPHLFRRSIQCLNEEHVTPNSCLLQKKSYLATFVRFDVLLCGKFAFHARGEATQFAPTVSSVFGAFLQSVNLRRVASAHAGAPGWV